MNNREASLWLCFLMLLTAAWFSVTIAGIERCAPGAQETDRGTVGETARETSKELAQGTEAGIIREQIRGQLPRMDFQNPVIRLQVLEQNEQKEETALTGKDYEILLRIVEAEAGSEDERGKLLVANVVLNRVNSEVFPDTVEQVVYQEADGKAQFSPVANGTIQKVTVGPETKKAVERALQGEDISEGALYFVSRKAADPDNLNWFDSHLTRLFSYGGHEFFR